jgi:hypothetical protein
MRTIAPLLVVVTLATLASAPSAAVSPTNDYLLVLDQRAGPYRFLDSSKSGHADAYSAALAAFGTPTRFLVDGNLCRVTWATAGVPVGFASADAPCRT